jgi:hypothetical protein
MGGGLERGVGGEVTQTMYAHVNKLIIMIIITASETVLKTSPK